MNKQVAHLDGVHVTYECEGRVMEYFIPAKNIKTETMADERVVIYATLNCCPWCDKAHCFSFLEGFDFPL